MSAPLCNLCGLTTYVGPAGQGCSGPSGLLHAKVTGGYESTPGNGSGALDDLSRYTFSLCEWCLDWLFQRFVIPVTEEDYMSPEMTLPPWKPAEERILEDEWRRQKKVFFQEKAVRDAARVRK